MPAGFCETQNPFFPVFEENIAKSSTLFLQSAGLQKKEFQCILYKQKHLPQYS